MRAAAEPPGQEIVIEDVVVRRICVCVRSRASELNIVAKLMPPIGVINARRSRTFFAGDISCRAQKHSTKRHVALRYRGRTPSLSVSLSRGVLFA